MTLTPTCRSGLLNAGPADLIEFALLIHKKIGNWKSEIGNAAAGWYDSGDTIGNPDTRQLNPKSYSSQGGKPVPADNLKELLERIHYRLDDSMVGIGAAVADLAAADLAELINQLTLSEAASVVSMLPLQRVVEICDQPTMRRRGAILSQLDPPRAAQI